MITPMAAKRPWITEAGKKLLNTPALNTPSNTCNAPEITITANAYLYPDTKSPSPNSVIAPSAITINPAAGPLIVMGDPDKKETTIPPIIAV